MSSVCAKAASVPAAAKVQENSGSRLVLCTNNKNKLCAWVQEVALSGLDLSRQHLTEICCFDKLSLKGSPGWQSL